MSELQDAAEAVVRTQEALRDAINGQGHDGTPHDRDLHVPLGGDFDVFSDSMDCAACGGAQYGAEAEAMLAIGDLRAALGHERRPWEER